jgi:hypothetical protein
MATHPRMVGTGLMQIGGGGVPGTTVGCGCAECRQHSTGCCI